MSCTRRRRPRARRHNPAGHGHETRYGRSERASQGTAVRTRRRGAGPGGRAGNRRGPRFAGLGILLITTPYCWVITEDAVAGYDGPEPSAVGKSGPGQAVAGDVTEALTAGRFFGWSTEGAANWPSGGSRSERPERACAAGRFRAAETGRAEHRIPRRRRLAGRLTAELGLARYRTELVGRRPRSDRSTARVERRATADRSRNRRATEQLPSATQAALTSRSGR